MSKVLSLQYVRPFADIKFRQTTLDWFDDDFVVDASMEQ